MLFEAFQDFLGRGDYFGGPKELFSSALAFLIDSHLFRRVREDSEQRLRDPVRRQHPPGRDGRANSQPGRQAQRGPSLARPSAGHAHKVRNITCFFQDGSFLPTFLLLVFQPIMFAQAGILIGAAQHRGIATNLELMPAV